MRTARHKSRYTKEGKPDLMKNKDKNQKKIREPKIKETALAVQTEPEEKVTLQNTSEIDPELLTGKEISEQPAEPATEDKEPEKETKTEPEKASFRYHRDTYRVHRSRSLILHRHGHGQIIQEPCYDTRKRYPER